MSEQDKQCREAFERVHCGNNKNVTVRNSTTDDYVIPAVQDAWAGWQSAWNSQQITVTKNESGQIVAVTRTDAEGKILEVVAESAPQAQLSDSEIKRIALQCEMQGMFTEFPKYKAFAKAIAARCGDEQLRQQRDELRNALSEYVILGRGKCTISKEHHALGQRAIERCKP